MTALILAATVAGCTRDGAAELMETAKFEELQQNVPHASELYQRIVDQYPDSDEAKVARERLAELNEPPGAKLRAGRNPLGNGQGGRAPSRPRLGHARAARG